MYHHDDSVFEKLRFRATTLKRIDAFSNVSGLWSRGENVSKTMRFQMKTH